MIVYVSGPYTYGNIDDNISQARKISIEIWEQGMTALCPHLNTAHFEKDCKCSYDDYIRGDLELVEMCDAIVMAPNWEMSKGAKIEKYHAELNQIPIYFYPELPDLRNSL